MGKIRDFFSENKQARQEHREGISWWQRKKHFEEEHEYWQSASWSKPIGTIQAKETDEGFRANIHITDEDVAKELGLSDTLDEAYSLTELNKRLFEEEMARPLVDEVPGYGMPASMLALKGSPTNNVGVYLNWVKKQLSENKEK